MPALAALAAIPALAVPFLADDWINLWEVRAGLPLRTPFGYFRPLYLASYWLESRLWGLRPLPFHATNVVLLVGCAALLGLLVRKYTSDPRWALATGVLFALHPYHVENAAWIAGRADTAATLLILLSLLAFLRRATDPVGIPWLSLLAFEAALLFKESVVLFPAMVLLLEGARGTRSRRGVLPLGCVALAHFLVLRPMFLEQAGLRPLSTFGLRWAKVLADFCTAAVLPLHIEWIEAHPRLLAVAALACLGLLAALSGLVLLRNWRSTCSLAALFVLAVLPSSLSFQERYFLLPSTISSTTLGFLLARARGRAAAACWVALLALWSGSLGAHWLGWIEAGKVSRNLVAGLTRASARPGLREIVIANQPYRVRGVPVAGNLRAAVLLSGGRPVDVRFATALDLPGAASSGLVQAPDGGTMEIHLPPRPFSRIFLPRTSATSAWATVVFEGPGTATVTVLPGGPSRGAYAWYGGKLQPLF